LVEIGQQHLIDFFRYRPLLPIGWRIVQILCQGRGTTTNTAPTTVLLVQYNQQANPLLSMNKYAPLVISRNDKLEQLTIIKPTQTGIKGTVAPD
jgi:hypothetical protein